MASLLLQRHLRGDSSLAILPTALSSMQAGGLPLYRLDALRSTGPLSPDGQNCGAGAHSFASACGLEPRGKRDAKLSADRLWRAARTRRARHTRAEGNR